MITPVFTVRVFGGRFVGPDVRSMYSWASKFEGKNIEVIIRPSQTGHTRSQRDYFHGVIITCFADYMGYDPSYPKDKKAVKEILKRYFGPKDSEGKIKKTRHYTRRDYSVLISGCMRAAAELGFYIPDPERISL